MLIHRLAQLISIYRPYRLQTSYDVIRNLGECYDDTDDDGYGDADADTDNVDDESANLFDSDDEDNDTDGRYEDKDETLDDWGDIYHIIVSPAVIARMEAAGPQPIDPRHFEDGAFRQTNFYGKSEKELDDAWAKAHTILNSPEGAGLNPSEVFDKELLGKSSAEPWNPWMSDCNPDYSPPDSEE